jgi:hypothetical protein
MKLVPNPIRRVREWKDSVQNDILRNSEKAVSQEEALEAALARIAELEAVEAAKGLERLEKHLSAVDANHNLKRQQAHDATVQRLSAVHERHATELESAAQRIASLETVLVASQAALADAEQKIADLKGDQDIQRQEIQEAVVKRLTALAESHKADIETAAQRGLALEAAMLANQSALSDVHKTDLETAFQKIAALEAMFLASLAAQAAGQTAELGASAQKITALETAFIASQSELAATGQTVAALQTTLEARDQEKQAVLDARFAALAVQHTAELERAKQRIASLEAVILANQASLSESEGRITALAAILTDTDIHKSIEGVEILRLNSTIARLSTSQSGLAEGRAIASELRVHRFEGLLRAALPDIDTADLVLLMAQRADEVAFLPVSRTDALQRGLGGNHPLQVIAAVARGEIAKGHVTDLADRTFPLDAGEKLVAAISTEPVGAYEWLQRRTPLPVEPGAVPEKETDRLQAVLAKPDLIDFFAHGDGEPNRPFDKPADLPSFSFAEPKRRSVLFVHHCYYNFFYLAKALRARGWDAVSLSTESPDSPHRRFYHGEDITIYDPDLETQYGQLRGFFRDAVDHFGMIQTYGKGLLSLFGSNYDTGPRSSKLPWDFLEAKRRGILLGYTHSGCADGVSQSRFRAWSKTMCETCVWEDQPMICSDEGNLTWGRKMTSVVDLFCTETDPPLDFKNAPSAFRAPLTLALDPEIWRLDLKIPARLRRERAKGEIIVYHAVGNYALRSRNGRNVKGTQAVLAAIKTLQQEGIPIRLDFIDDVPSIDNRFIQMQADIIIDQLNYGRYGALAREGMMLGKPVIGCVNLWDGPDLPATQCILDTPIVHATEESLIDVLRDLALNPKKRKAIGLKSREHALHWWSADRLAARFEMVHDHLRAQGRPPAEMDVP